jgi:hypothetical protein
MFKVDFHFTFSCYDFVRLFSSPVRFEGFRLLVTANVVASSLILSALNMEATRSSETSIQTRPTPRHIPEGSIPLFDLLRLLSSITFSTFCILLHLIALIISLKSKI